VFVDIRGALGAVAHWVQRVTPSQNNVATWEHGGCRGDAMRDRFATWGRNNCCYHTGPRFARATCAPAAVLGANGPRPRPVFCLLCRRDPYVSETAFACPQRQYLLIACVDPCCVAPLVFQLYGEEL
jgi:hypothetical protein